MGLILTSIAGIVEPSTSILPSVLAYGFLPMLGVNVLFVILWLLMSKWFFLISLGAIILRFHVVTLFLQVGGNADLPAPDENPDIITLMSYNLHNFSGNGFKASPNDTNALDFLTMLHHYSPDILCLQEYREAQKVKVTDSLTLLGYNHYYGCGGTSSNPTGTVVFSKIPITFVKKIDRQKLLVELMRDEQKFRLLCVHMNSYSFNAHDRADIEQMAHLKIDTLSRQTLSKAKETVLRHEEEWRDLLQPIVSETTMPLLMAGDMNDIPSSWLYSNITQYLSDTYCDEGTGFATTYNGSFPRFRIDMVFHSHHFTTLSHKRIKVPFSDHYPVLVSFQLDTP